MNNYSINGNFIYEGYGIENINTTFQWFYTERGKKEVLKHFTTERDIIKHAFKEIKPDKYASSHFIGLFTNKKALKKVISKLINRKINYWTDSSYIDVNEIRTRIFIVGCGIKKVKDLIQNK